MYKLLVYSDELYHYGVLGMRWGVRRYQDYKGHRIKGGPVTNPSHAGHPQSLRDTVVGGQGGKAKGTEQLAATANKKPKAKDVAEKLATPSVKQGKGREDISPAEDITKKAKRVAESGERIAEFGEKHDKSVQQKNEEARQKQMNKAKKMSDKELRDSINRIKMEREYTSLTTKEVESGWTKAKDILSVSKEVLEITGAIVGIIASIMAIKKGMGMKQSGIFTKAFLNEQLSVENLPEDVLIHAMDLDEQYLMAAYDISEEDVQDYIKHHGIKGMKWGVRRYQNYDGTRISTGTPNLPKPSSLGRGVGSGAGGGGGGHRADSNPVLQKRRQQKAIESFKKSVAGGQGGKAVGNERLAANAGGIKNAKWGDKRYQNRDGSLTDAGRKEYYDHHKVGNVEWDSLNDKGQQAQMDYRKTAVVDRANTIAYNTKRANDVEYLNAKSNYQNNMYLMQNQYVSGKVKNSDSMTKEQLTDAWAGSKDASTYYKLKNEYLKQVERVVKEGYGDLYNKPYKSIDPSPYNKSTTLGEEISKEILRQTEWEYYTARDKQRTIKPQL